MVSIQNSVKSVLIGDIHYGTDSEFRPGKEIPGLLSQFVEIMNREMKPDVVMELGDRINNVDKETDVKNLSRLVETLDHKLNMPCYHVLGNHDIVYTDKKTISQVIGDNTGPLSRVIKGFKFIILDTLDPMIENTGGAVGKEQLAWLEREMNTDDYPKLVFGHHPIDNHTMRGSAIQSKNRRLIFLENRSEVREILENGKNFIGYAAGHMHWFSFFCSKNAAYLVNPSFTEAYPSRINAPGMFLEVDIYTHGKVEAALHTLNPRRLLGRFTSKE
jgi:hypothetical protein